MLWLKENLPKKMTHQDLPADNHYILEAEYLGDMKHVVLCLNDSLRAAHRYVTWIAYYKPESKFFVFYNGHYHTDIAEAVRDYSERLARGY